MSLGGTVGKLKHRMSYPEFYRWCDYFTKHGRCTPTRMYDRGFALLAWRIDMALHVDQPDMTNYLPYYKQPDKEATLSDIVKELGGVKRG